MQGCPGQFQEVVEGGNRTKRALQSAPSRSPTFQLSLKADSDLSTPQYTLPELTLEVVKPFQGCHK